MIGTVICGCCVAFLVWLGCLDLVLCYISGGAASFGWFGFVTSGRLVLCYSGIAVFASWALVDLLFVRFGFWLLWV